MTTHVGRVVAFDGAAGLGEVRDSVSGRTHPFHCTQIADGSRLIEVGTEVTYQLAAGHLGRWEARTVRSALQPTATHVCPVCATTVDGPLGAYAICPCCGWEDDPVQSDDPGYTGGANHQSLNDARTAWVAAQRDR